MAQMVYKKLRLHPNDELFIWTGSQWLQWDKELDQWQQLMPGVEPSQMVKPISEPEASTLQL